MAQQDTGLGWSAKQEWLVSVPGVLALINYATGFPGQPLPYLGADPAPADVKNAGVYVGEQKTGSNITLEGWACTLNDDHPFLCKVGSQYFILRPSPEGTANCYIRIAYFRKSNGQFYTSGGFTTLFSDSQVSNNFYYNPFTYAYSVTTNALPEYSTIDDAAADLHYYNIPYYKLNAGYAVACVAKWASLAGDYVTTPVLISSDRDAVILSNDGSTEIADQMIASYLQDGIRFYMSFLNLRDLVFTGYSIPAPDLSQFGAAQPEKVFRLLATESYANIQIIAPPDPYEILDGESTEEGGDGEGIVDEPVLNDTHSVPSGGGFYKIFTPSLSQLMDLSNYLWGTLDINNFKRIFSSPIDCILGLGIVPITLSGTSSPVYIGGVDTQLSFPLVTDEVYDFDFGYVQIAKSTGSYLDYSPYTKISVYLPFIGFRELDTDDVMGEAITLKYRIDIATGACIARLSRMGTTLYQFAGSCLKQLPITGTNWDNAITGAITTAAAIGSTVATAGATAPVLAGAVASAATQALTTKSTSQRSGSLSASSGLLGGIIPYIVRSTPKEVIPGNQNRYIGYPAYVSKQLGNISGYNEIASIHLEGIPATGDELSEIETLLKGGVIL